MIMRALILLLTLVTLAGCAGSASDTVAGGSSAELPVSEVPTEADSGVPGSTGSGEILCAELAPEGEMTTDAPGCQTPDEQAKGEQVTPRPGMANVAPLRWQTAEPGSDDQTLRVTYTSGVEPCYVLDSVEVEESPEQVTVTLLQGSDPAAGDAVCIEIAEQRVVEVPLSAPLGDRPVVDGSQ